MKWLEKYFYRKEFLKFILIGGINALNGTVLSYIYAGFMQANIAFSIGYMTSLTIAYVLNTIFIFHKKFGFFDYIKFTISYIPNFLIQSGVVFIVFNILGWYKLIAYILAAMIGIPVTYVILNVFAFKKDEQKPIAK